MTSTNILQGRLRQFNGQSLLKKHYVWPRNHEMAVQLKLLTLARVRVQVIGLIIPNTSNPKTNVILAEEIVRVCSEKIDLPLIT